MTEYRNVAQYQDQAFEWDPAAQIWSGGIQETSPGYLPMLFQFQDLVRSGQAEDFEAEQYRNWEQAARAIPTRDIGTLKAGWQGQYGGQWGDEGWQEGNPEWWSRLDPLSPDVGPIMLGIRDRMDAGTASPQERALYGQVLGMAQDWNTRASVPQASDAPSPFGDNLLQALGIIGLGATGGLAAAPLFAGGAGLATTLGSLGTLSGIAGTGVGVLGGALKEPFLQKAGLGLGALGGVLGGLGGLSSLWGTGVQSLSDAAKLASSAGKITGAIGSASGNDALRQASRYLGQAGQLGQFGAGVLPSSVTDWSGTNAPWAANVAPGISGVSNLLSAADVATQRGGGMEWDYSNDWGASAPYDDWSWNAGATAPDYFQSDAYKTFTGWGGDETQMPWYQGADLDTSGAGGGGWLSSVLGGLGGLSGLLGPAASALGSLGAGALGSRASSDAAALQAAALNRGIDLQTAQWLQSQANQAPWIEAGRGALGELTWRQAQEQSPALPGATPAISGANYAMPSATPGWMPQMYSGPQAPNAGDYRFNAPATVNPAQYAWNPQAALDPSQYAFSAPNGQELLARDPGYQFRQEEARKALEASALARGTGMSGATLQALQARSQDLASQEYGQAYGRALGENQLRYGRGLTQSQEDYQRQLLANQLGYGRATEQQQLGYQQGLGANQFHWQSALQGQQNAFNQGLTAQQWNVGQQQQYQNELYNRLMQQNQLGYGRDVYSNETQYAREQQAYQQQIAEMTRQWNQAAGLAGVGQTSVGQIGQQGQAAQQNLSSLLAQLGAAQGTGAAGSGLAWTRALGGATNQLPSILAGLNA